MTQSSLFLYFLLISFSILTFSNLKNFYKFFFFTEIIWLLIFLILTLNEGITSSNGLLVNILFILIFTAIEAIIIACIFLLNSKIWGIKF